MLQIRCVNNTVGNRQGNYQLTDCSPGNSVKVQSTNVSYKTISCCVSTILYIYYYFIIITNFYMISSGKAFFVPRSTKYTYFRILLRLGAPYPHQLFHHVSKDVPSDLLFLLRSRMNIYLCLCVNGNFSRQEAKRIVYGDLSHLPLTGWRLLVGLLKQAGKKEQMEYSS